MVWRRYMLFNDFCADDLDVLEGTVVAVLRLCGDFVDHLHAGDNLAEDGVVAVKEGCAADGGVGLDLFRGEGLAGACGDHVELVLREDVAVHDVELGAGGGLRGVVVAGCGHGAALVVERGHELGGYALGGAAHAEALAGLGGLGVGVARLDHEALDDAVEEHTVVVTLLHQLDEVVAVKRGFVVEGDGDVAHGGLDQYLCHFIFFGFRLYRIGLFFRFRFNLLLRGAR